MIYIYIYTYTSFASTTVRSPASHLRILSSWPTIQTFSKRWLRSSRMAGPCRPKYRTPSSPASKMVLRKVATGPSTMSLECPLEFLRFVLSGA